MPFLQQTAGYCGPATLAMALSSQGQTTTPEEVGPLVYTPGLKGTLQEDMISAGRRQGFMTVKIQGMESLLAEVTAGHPVIVFENLALSWLPQWHYALVFGYDLNTQTVTMHSGPEAFKRWDLRRFERSWMLADYWGVVLLKPGELAASASEYEQSKAASALESLGKTTEAEKAYRAILRRWPESLVSGIGLANIAYSHGRAKEALQLLTESVRRHPESMEAWHNLSVAQASLGLGKESRQSAERAAGLE
ncbi:MAG: PA2778 family cysteine peptidase [Bdellovibrionales bacterium]|nr:PA2778 family cysteine peptidase [Bdellovibrionales bacterium]